MKRDYSQLFAICNKNDLNYKDVVSEFTNKRTKSPRDLSDEELAELMLRLQPHNPPPPGDAQRKKMIAIAKLMKWGSNTNEIKDAINQWLLKQKYGKPLMQLDLQQLNLMVHIFETKVYADYLKGLNK